MIGVLITHDLSRQNATIRSSAVSGKTRIKIRNKLAEVAAKQEDKQNNNSCGSYSSRQVNALLWRQHLCVCFRPRTEHPGRRRLRVKRGKSVRSSKEVNRPVKGKPALHQNQLNKTSLTWLRLLVPTQSGPAAQALFDVASKTNSEVTKHKQRLR